MQLVLTERQPTAPKVEPPLRKRSGGSATAAVARSFLFSRLLVLAGSCGAVLALGFGPQRKVFQHAQLTHGFGAVGNVLLAGSARWDAAWYLLIAHSGYAPGLGSATVARDAFFPLYPLLVRALAVVGLPAAAAGVAISLCAFAVALALLYRLTELELAQGLGWEPERARRAAGLAVALLAFAPVSFFFSAIYPEGLFLALSLAVFWFARQGQLLRAAVCAALASAARPTGVVLAVPALVLYLYGPRSDGLPERLAGPLLPRYRAQPKLLTIVLAPLGLVVFCLYLALAGGSLTGPFSAQALWGRQFAGPYVALFDGAKAAIVGLAELLGGGSSAAQVAASHNVELFCFAAFAVLGTVGVLRKLPLAYGLYLLTALLLPLSYPATGEPLMSLPRFLLVLFPFYIWLAVELEARPRLKVAVLAFSALALLFYTGSFATWHWVS